HRLADTEFHAASSHSVGYGIIYGCLRSEHGSIHKVRAKGTRPTADIPVADRDQAPAPAFILQPRFLWSRFICLPLQVPTPAPFPRRTGTCRSVSLCESVSFPS